ncbi:conserved protein of unknown function [Candidatus Hydrogenisulfobacillus filiaventi]|uniref:Uncharacterized protein n=1 Tax=Candidatus Hydrogenisulfobacillus filiaventi TaxID=2707344 RepID=A0A6F8ZG40_9FIRM|nr:conserved protein of unknown function [Candidatus Hydrogenisulfobacillus filiaventi]
MPLGNMNGRLTLGVLILILGLTFLATALIERKTPGVKRLLQWLGALGAVFTVGGVSLLLMP